jgi:hypothetical protein
MTTSRRSGHMSWTELGVRMGFTSEQSQREEILAAIERMNWAHTSAGRSDLDGQAVRAIVNAVVHHRRGQRRSIVRVGIAHLNGGRQLIGLQDSLGTRSYVLDLDSEAVYVLAELPHSLAPAQPAADHTRVA